MKKKILIGLMALTLLTGCGNEVIGYVYEDNYEPGSQYEVSINYGEKTLYVKETDYCSIEGCEPTVSEVVVDLTKEEIKLIKKITANEYDQAWLTSSLVLITKDGLICSTKDDSSWEWYKNSDYDANGVVTSREQGLYNLNEMVNNPNKEAK